MQSERPYEPGDKPSPAENPLAERVEFTEGTLPSPETLASLSETAELDRVLTRATQLFPDALIAPDASEADTTSAELADDGDEVDSEENERGELKPADSEASRLDDTASEETEKRAPRKRSGINVLSVVALVMAMTLSPLAVVFGYLALGQTRRASQRGEGVALWAIGLGWLALAVWVVAIGALVAIGLERGVTWEDLQAFTSSFGSS